MLLMRKMNRFYTVIFVKEHSSILYRINGMSDHLHLFVELHQTISVAEFVRKLKKATHLFLDANKDLFPDFTAWSVGYCAFILKIKRYIIRQAILKMK